MIRVLLLIVLSPFAVAEEWAGGLPVDTPFPNVEATSQFNETWDREKLLGENGLLFLFNRSTSW